MTVIHPDGATRDDPAAGECFECGSTSFTIYLIDRGDAARIVGVRCVVCGDTTDFVAAPPDVHN